MSETDDSGFVWGEDRLESATQEELIGVIEEQHERLERLEAELTDLRETVNFILDVQAGQTDQYRPFDERLGPGEGEE